MQETTNCWRAGDLWPWREYADRRDNLAVILDRNGVEVLPRAECLHLLAEAHLGRIALSMGALPVILPVNFAMLDDDILIRTAPGTKLEAATRNAVVAFEVDNVDPVYHTGWSVLAQGIAKEITDSAELERARCVPLVPWAGADGHYIHISPEFIAGRRLLLPPASPDTTEPDREPIRM